MEYPLSKKEYLEKKIWEKTCKVCKNGEEHLSRSDLLVCTECQYVYPMGMDFALDKTGVCHKCESERMRHGEAEDDDSGSDWIEEQQNAN